MPKMEPDKVSYVNGLRDGPRPLSSGAGRSVVMASLRPAGGHQIEDSNDERRGQDPRPK